MSDYEKDPNSGSTKEKSKDASDRWTNEGGAPPEKKDPKMSAGTPRTDEDKKYEASEESASERSEKDQG